jgi:hypothetical protein
MIVDDAETDQGLPLPFIARALTSDDVGREYNALNLSASTKENDDTTIKTY